MDQPKTKKEKVCRLCGGTMEDEHPAAKTCLKCRDPKKYEELQHQKIQPMGEEIKDNESASPPPPNPVQDNIPFFLRPGDVVSINLKQRRFLILPKSGWKLSPRIWSDTIPMGIDPIEMRMLRICLEAGDIIKGKKFTGIRKDKETLKKAVAILDKDNATLRNSLGKMVQHKGLIGGYFPYDIFRYLIRYEEDNAHRKAVREFLQNALETLRSAKIRVTPVVNKSIDEITGLTF